MDAYLRGGPANGRTIPHPKMLIYRHPIPKPIELVTPQEALNAAMNAEPNMDVADYEFTGFARITLYGEMQYVIYDFKGME